VVFIERYIFNAAGENILKRTDVTHK